MLIQIGFPHGKLSLYEWSSRHACTDSTRVRVVSARSTLKSRRREQSNAHLSHLAGPSRRLRIGTETQGATGPHSKRIHHGQTGVDSVYGSCGKTRRRRSQGTTLGGGPTIDVRRGKRRGVLVTRRKKTHPAIDARWNSVRSTVCHGSGDG